VVIREATWTWRSTNERGREGERRIAKWGKRRNTRDGVCGGNTQPGGGGRATPCYLSIITLQDLDLSLQPVVSF